MAQPISINTMDRNTKQRSPDTAVRELHEAVIAVNACMESLATAYPRVTVIAGIEHGKAVSALARVPTLEGCDRYNPAAMSAARHLAEIVASLPDELRAAFEIELSHARTRDKIDEEERARAEALRTAAEGHRGHQ
jgi:hypothetical protein